mgnify:CR=1 FL=1
MSADSSHPHINEHALPQGDAARDYAVKHFGEIVIQEGQSLVGWRDVPTDNSGLGAAVIASMPVIRQAIVAASPAIKDQNAFERKILAIRKQILNNLRTLSEKRKIPGLDALYMPSFSTRTVVYKGLLLAPQVGGFYMDLRDPLCQSALALVPQWFSNQQFRSWNVGQP